MRLLLPRDGTEVRVKLPQEANDNQINTDQIGLHSSLYQQLFGKRFGADQGGKPWKRGVVTVVGRRGQVGSQKIRLLFQSGALRGVSKDTCLIAPNARQMLGIRAEGEGVTLIIEPQWYARALFYWNHPDHHARVAFKLGSVAFAIASGQVGASVVRLLW